MRRQADDDSNAAFSGPFERHTSAVLVDDETVEPPATVAGGWVRQPHQARSVTGGLSRQQCCGPTRSGSVRLQLGRAAADERGEVVEANIRLAARRLGTRSREGMLLRALVAARVAEREQDEASGATGNFKRRHRILDADLV